MDKKKPTAKVYSYPLFKTKSGAVLTVAVFCSSAICEDLFVAYADIIMNNSCPVRQGLNNDTGKCVCIHHEIPEFINCYII